MFRTVVPEGPDPGEEAKTVLTGASQAVTQRACVTAAVTACSELTNRTVAMAAAPMRIRSAPIRARSPAVGHRARRRTRSMARSLAAGPRPAWGSPQLRPGKPAEAADRG